MNQISDNYAINDQSNVVRDSVSPSHGSPMDGHGDTWVHHTNEPQYFILPGGACYYSNLALSAYETVDFSLVADLIQIWMGPAVMGAAMAASHTLGGLMAATSMIGVVPSLMELLICISLIGIEANVVSPLMQAARMNGKNFYQALSASEVQKRFKDVRSSESMDRNEKGVYRAILPVTLLSLYIFKNAYENHDQELTGVTYTELYNQCFNVAHMIGIPQLNGGGSHIGSFMWAICSVMLGIYNCSRGQGGWGSQLVYYQHYSRLKNFAIHNVFFKYRWPWKSKVKATPNNRNSFVSYVARMLFCMNYSNFTVYVKQAKAQRQNAYTAANLNKAPDERVEFDRYLFDNGVASTTREESIYNQIGLDSIQQMLQNMEAEDPDPDVQAKFDELMGFADEYAEGYKTIMEIYKGKRCVFGRDILDLEKVESFWDTKANYNNNFKINSKVINDVSYSHEKVLNFREDTSKAKEWKKIYLTAIGNHITLGYFHVGWYKYNWNPATFDIYVKVKGQYQIIQNVSAIVDVINNNTFKDVNPLMVDDLEILERVFDGKSDEGTPEQQQVDQDHLAPLQPMIDFVADIGNVVEAMTIRSVYKTDIWDHDI